MTTVTYSGNDYMSRLQVIKKAAHSEAECMAAAGVYCAVHENCEPFGSADDGMSFVVRVTDADGYNAYYRRVQM